MLENLLVLSDLTFDSAEQAIRFGAQKLHEKGYVKDGYADSVVERERIFPTGLPTEPFGIAIPHTNSDMVNVSSLCFMKLNSPLRFQQMGDEECHVDARIVILLAIACGGEHLELLSSLMELFSDEALLEQISQVDDVDKLTELLSAART